MKNSSTQFLLIGSGRLARHLEFYFIQNGFTFTIWNRRRSAEELNQLAEKATHILLAISDAAIEGFINEHFRNLDKTLVHFSGALHLPGVISAHPLMTFGPHFYTNEIYEKIHFVLCETDRLTNALPGFNNPYSVIKAEQKPYYHALCVMGGNFPVILWQKMADEFKKLGLPPEAHLVYLEKVTENFMKHGSKALTGPLVRNDQATLQSNINALEGDAFELVYRAFVEAYK